MQALRSQQFLGTRYYCLGHWAQPIEKALLKFGYVKFIFNKLKL